MTLYHGTNADFSVIDLSQGLRYKDFGKGFYLTPDRQTAIRMAQKKARLFGGSPTLITYEMEDSVLHSDLKVKVFPEKRVQNGSFLYMPIVIERTLRQFMIMMLLSGQ